MPAATLLPLLVLGVFGGSIATLAVLFRRLTLTEVLTFLDRKVVRVVPWGGWSVAFVFVLWMALELAVVVTAYNTLDGLRPAPPDVAKRSSPESPAPGSSARTGEPNRAEKRPNAEPTVKAHANPRTLIALNAITNTIRIVLIPIVLFYTSGARLRDYGLTFDQPLRDLKWGLAAFFAVTPLVMAIHALANAIFSKGEQHPVQEMLRSGLTSGWIALAYLSAVVLAPISEELLFRGILQGWALRRDLPPRVPASLSVDGGTEAMDDANEPVRAVERLTWFPVLATSFLFALIHFQQMPAPIPLFFLALTLGWLKQASGSLVPSIVLHAAFNGLNTTLMILVLSMPSSQRAGEEDVVPPPAGAEKRVENGSF